MPYSAFSPLSSARVWRLLGQCAAGLGIVAGLVACGGGYRGYFVWGNQPPAEDGDSGLVIVVTKAQLNTMQEARLLSQHQVELQHTSTALRSELARLLTTDETHCELGGTVYELVLQWPQHAERYRSHNWSCSAAPAAQPKDYISAADLASFAQQLAKEQ